MKYRMPAEYAPHSATIMIWCQRSGSWIYGAKHAAPIFAQVISKIAEKEKVYVAVGKKSYKIAEEYLKEQIRSGAVELWQVATDDCWARDMAPTFVVGEGKLCGIDWKFNAWGGDFDGLYANWRQDDEFAKYVCEKLKVERVKARPFVLEGGSIHVDGEGTLITTEECLLSKGRNPKLTKEQIEDKLKEYLRVNRVVWLPYGVVGDETNGHVDNICAFVGKDKVVHAWTDEDGEQKRRCEANLKVLQEAGIEVIKMPLPKVPVAFTQYEVDGFEYEEGEAKRNVGEVLAASYVNYYVCNAGVLVPQFGDDNDALAVEILSACFPNREVIPIYARDLIVGGGNIHCLTQQIPEVKV